MGNPMNPPVPPITQERIVENAHAELSKLIDELAEAVAATRGRINPNWQPVRDMLVRMRHLMADAQLAGMLLGMLSPWLPTVADVPKGTPPQVRAREPVEMGIRALSDLVPLRSRGLVPEDEWRFPELEDAVDWLVNQQSIVTDDELVTLQQQLHREAFTLDVDDLRTVQRFQSALSESLLAGESFPEFRKRITDIADVTRSQAETAYRTNTKQAFLAGQAKTLEQPRVRERFRWVYYAATKDNRTRPDHWALDGYVAEIGTPLHRLMLEKQAAYNCLLPGSRVSGNVEAAMRLRYRGQAVEIVTESGAVLRVTENHPMLTEHGWVRAGSVQQGQQLIRNVSEVDVVSGRLPRPSNVHDEPAVAEEVFRAFAAAGPPESGECEARHFHGDGAFVEGDVEIVWPRRKLLRAWEAAVADQFSNLILEPATLGFVTLLDLVRTCGIAHAAPFQSLRFGPPTRLDSVLQEAAINHATLNAEAVRQRLDRLTGDESLADAGVGQDEFVAAGWHAEPLHPLADGRRLASELLGDLKDGQPALVSGDKVMSVSAISHDGYVYDFQTSTGVIEACGGILVSNCRCALIPLDETKAERYGVKTLSDVPAEYR